MAKITIFISLRPTIYFLSIATLTSPSFFPILNIPYLSHLPSSPTSPYNRQPIPPRIQYQSQSAAVAPFSIPILSSHFHFPIFICAQHQLPSSHHNTPQRFNWLCRGGKYPSSQPPTPARPPKRDGEREKGFSFCVFSAHQLQ